MMKKAILLLLVFLLTIPWVSVSGQEEIVWESVPIAYGDLNQDGQVTAKDALRVLQYTVGKASLTQETPTDAGVDMMTLADVNQDEQIDARDALAILKRSVGISVAMPDTVWVGNASNQNTIRVGTLFMEDYKGIHKDLYQTTWETIGTKKQLNTYMEPITEEQVTSTLANQIKAGMSGYDLLELSPAMALQLAKQNLITPLNSLDLTAFSAMATDYMTFDQKVYGVSFDAITNDPLVVYYNKEWASQRAPQIDVESLVKNHEWTLPVFEEWVGACFYQEETGQGIVEKYNGFAGCMDTTFEFTTAISGPIGIRSQKSVTVDGLYDRLQEGFDGAISLYKVFKSAWKTSKEGAWTQFVTGKAMCTLAPLGKLSLMCQKASFSVGVAPVPLGEQATSYSVCHSRARVFAVPIDKQDRLEPIGQWLEEMANAGGKLMNRTVKELVLRTNTAGDWYKEIMKNQQWDYAVDVLSSAIVSQFQSAHLTKQPSKILPSIEAATEKEINDFYDPLEKTS